MPELPDVVLLFLENSASDRKPSRSVSLRAKTALRSMEDAVLDFVAVGAATIGNSGKVDGHVWIACFRSLTRFDSIFARSFC